MSSQPRPGTQGKARQKPLILIVDDLALNVVVLESKLYKQGFDTIHACFGPATLEIAETELSDLIRLDVMMPQMDGFEVCSGLKSNPRTTHIPVILLTTLSDSADRLRGFEAGADDFLTKPFMDNTLFGCMCSLIGRRAPVDDDPGSRLPENCRSLS